MFKKNYFFIINNNKKMLRLYWLFIYNDEDSVWIEELIEEKKCFNTFKKSLNFNGGL